MSAASGESPSSLSLRDAVLALAVAAVWGSNFVVIKVGLAEIPPLAFAALRFVLAAFPAVLFVRRPAVPWRDLAAYGVLIGAGQFGLLYIAMKSDISAGLASLVVQAQAVFTIGLAIILTGERVRTYQWVAVALAASGIVVIALRARGEATPLGLGLVGVAALSWASGNLVARRSGKVNMLGYVVWASLFSAPPLIALSLIFEGWPTVSHAIAHAGPAAWGAALWQSAGNSLFGYAVWGWLLARYPAATVSPVSLLVPVFGMAAAALVLGEGLPAWKLAAAALVLGGLGLNMLWPLVRRRAA